MQIHWTWMKHNCRLFWTIQSFPTLRASGSWSYGPCVTSRNSEFRRLSPHKKWRYLVKHLMEAIVNVAVFFSSCNDDTRWFEDQKNHGVVGGSKYKPWKDGWLIRTVWRPLPVHLLYVDFLHTPANRNRTHHVLNNEIFLLKVIVRKQPVQKMNNAFGGIQAHLPGHCPGNNNLSGWKQKSSRLGFVQAQCNRCKSFPVICRIPSASRHSGEVNAILGAGHMTRRHHIMAGWCEIVNTSKFHTTRLVVQYIQQSLLALVRWHKLIPLQAHICAFVWPATDFAISVPASAHDTIPRLQLLWCSLV